MPPASRRSRRRDADGSDRDGRAPLFQLHLPGLRLLTTLGGSVYPWTSAPTFILAIAGVLLIIGFLFTERRAAEPVMPLELFRNPVFSFASAIGFVVGFALFGATT